MEDLEIQVELGLGDESATYWTCDLSHEYIAINAGASPNLLVSFRLEWGLEAYLTARRLPLVREPERSVTRMVGMYSGGPARDGACTAVIQRVVSYTTLDSHMPHNTVASHPTPGLELHRHRPADPSLPAVRLLIDYSVRI